MKKSFIALSISSALLSYHSYATPSSAVAQSPTEVMVITANRSVQQQFNVLASVDVFDRQEIEQLQPVSVADLLSRTAGINVTTQGSAAHQTSVFVRGTNSNQVLILVDGVRVGSATLGEKNLADIPLQLIDRIEVVRGPRAALWGSDAIGGVIQIFTRQLAPNEAQLGATVGTHLFGETYAAIGLGNAKHHYTISASAETSQGFNIIQPAANNPYAVNQADKDGYNRQAIAINGDSQLADNLDIAVKGQYVQGKTEIDALYTGDETFYHNHQLSVTSNWRLPNATVHFNLAHSSDNNHDNADKLFVGELANRFDTTRQQASLQIELPQLVADIELITGVDWYQERVSSNNLYAKTKRNAHALYITGRKAWHQLKFEGSVRHDKVGDTLGETTHQLAIGYDITPNWLVAFNQGTAFKAPTFNDLYWPTAFGSAGNPNLLSETVRNSELLTRFKAPQYSLALSVYHSYLANLIEWRPVDSTDPYSGWQPENIKSATIKGVELTLTARLVGTEHTLTLTHLDARDNSTNQQLARRPHFSANYAVNYSINDWHLTANINHQGRRLDSNGASLSSYTLINITASLALTKQLTLSASSTNLANQHYMQVTDYPGDTRGYRLNVDYKF